LKRILIELQSFKISALINFVILALVVFMIAKAVLKEEKVTKK